MRQQVVVMVAAGVFIGVAQSARAAYDVGMVVRLGDDGPHAFLTDGSDGGVQFGYAAFRELSKKGQKGETRGFYVKEGRIHRIQPLRSRPENVTFLQELPDRSTMLSAGSRDGRYGTGWAFAEGGHRHVIRVDTTRGEVDHLGVPPGAVEAVGVDVNTFGAVLVNATVEGGTTRSFVFHQGEWHKLGTLGGSFTRAFDINNAFQVAGESDRRESDGRPVGFVTNKDGGSLETLSTPETFPGFRRTPLRMRIATDSGFLHGEILGHGFRQFFSKTPRGVYVLFGKHETKSWPISGNEHGAVLGKVSKVSGPRYVLWRPGEKRVYVRTLIPEKYRNDIRPFTVVSIDNRGVLSGSFRKGGRWYGFTLRPSQLKEVPPIPAEPDENPLEQQQRRRRNLIFITHGWRSSAVGYVRQLGNMFDRMLTRAGERERWHLVTFDWSQRADFHDTETVKIGGIEIGSDSLGDFLASPPIDAARHGRRIGLRWGEIYDRQNPRIVHLIGHSAGAHVVDAIAEELNDGDTHVHVTFLDAYIPVRDIGTRPFGADADFAEHYRDSRTLAIGSILDTLGRTMTLGDFLGAHGRAGPALPHCYNVDVANEDPARPSWIIEKPIHAIFRWSEHHAWPPQYYIRSRQNSESVGLDLAPALRGEGSLVTHDEYPRGEDVRE